MSATECLCSSCQKLDLYPGQPVRNVSKLPHNIINQIGRNLNCAFCRLVRWSSYDESDEDASDENIGSKNASDKDTSDEDTSNKDISSEDASDEDASDKDASNEDVGNKNVGSEDISNKDVGSEDISNKDASDEDASDEDTSNKDVNSEDASDEDARNMDGSGKDGGDEIDNDGDNTMGWNTRRGFNLGRDGNRFVFLSEDPTISPHESGRIVGPQLDFSLIKKWLQLCEDVHGSTCAPVTGVIRTPQAPSGLETLRVVDVENMCIAEASPGCRYLTLSYVWGGVPTLKLTVANKAELMAARGLENRLSDLPRTICDAIELTRLIKERYLWIDTLCLVQDDPVDMQDSINKMDLVYEGTILCIVAAAGKNANAGLPGLRRTASRTQHIEEIAPEVKMTRVGLLYNMLRGTYMTRGWTYQEFMLAPRCLIFLKSRVFYRCCHVVWSEDLAYDNFPSMTHENVGQSSGYHIFRKELQKSPMAAYTRSLFRYGDRKLTHQSDTLNAMQGILQRISRSMNGGVCEGLITSCFDLNIMFYNPSVFPSKRRPGFPSWSWAGWKTSPHTWVPEWDKQDALEWLATKTHIVWYKRCLRTGELSLICDPSAHRTRFAQTRQKQEAADERGFRYGAHDKDDVLQTHSTMPTLDIAWKDIPYRYSALQFWTWTVLVSRLEPSEDGLASVFDTEGAVCGVIYLDDRKFSLDTGRMYEAILLSEGENCYTFTRPWMPAEAKGPFYWVMLIKWHRMYAERMGLGFIYRSNIDRFANPGKVWKEILLA